MTVRAGGAGRSAVLARCCLVVLLLALAASLGDEWRPPGSGSHSGAVYMCPECMIEKTLRGLPPFYCYGDRFPGNTKHPNQKRRMRRVPGNGISK